MIDSLLDKIQKSVYAKFKNINELRTAVNDHVRTVEAIGLSAPPETQDHSLIRLSTPHISCRYPSLFRKQRTIGVWLKKIASLGIVNILVDQA